MAKTIQLKDKGGDSDKLYPITLTNAVIDADGALLEERLKTLESKLVRLLDASSWDLQ